MMLQARIRGPRSRAERKRLGYPVEPAKARRDTRWKCPAHTGFVADHPCVNCGSKAGIEAAHVRLGSHAGGGRKPDDWRTVALCAVCHRTGPYAQHVVGEETFWRGKNPDALIAAFIKASPRRQEIERTMREREA